MGLAKIQNLFYFPRSLVCLAERPELKTPGQILPHLWIKTGQGWPGGPSLALIRAGFEQFCPKSSKFTVFTVFTVFAVLTFPGVITPGFGTVSTCRHVPARAGPGSPRSHFTVLFDKTDRSVSIFLTFL